MELQPSLTHESVTPVARPMKIDYDPAVYRRIDNLKLDQIVQVRNAKGQKISVHITNIARLSWRELQLLSPYGSDRYSKMVLLYDKFTKFDPVVVTSPYQNGLSEQEEREIRAYVDIFKQSGFSEHFEVNKFISANALWDEFPLIRSLNDHGDLKNIKGIQPKYFELICQILKISGNNGRPLDTYRTY